MMHSLYIYEKGILICKRTMRISMNFYYIHDGVMTHTHGEDMTNMMK